jgi:hypothetical protein
MARYDFVCRIDGRFEVSLPMCGAIEAACPTCGAQAKRIYTLPQFTQDTLRLWRNHIDGSRFSYTLGQEMPETRRDLERLYIQKGWEPVSKATMPEEWKENAEYRAQVDAGGQREKPKPDDTSKGTKVADLVRAARFRVNP